MCHCLSNASSKSSNNLIVDKPNDMLSLKIERFWEIDSYGTKANLQQGLINPSEKQALNRVSLLKKAIFKYLRCGTTKILRYQTTAKYCQKVFIH